MKFKKIRQSGLTPILILVMVVAIAILGYFSFKNININLPAPTNQPPLADSSPDPTQNWKIYSTNTISFKYPESLFNNGKTIKGPITGNPKLITTINDTAVTGAQFTMSLYEINLEKTGLSFESYLEKEAYAQRNSPEGDKSSGNYDATLNDGNKINFIDTRGIRRFFILSPNSKILISIATNNAEYTPLYKILSTFKFNAITENTDVVSGEKCSKLLISSPTLFFNDNQNSGVVSGSVFYPSEGLPKDIKVCAFNLTKKIRYCSAYVVNNNPTYSLKLPAGSYYIYTLANNMIGVGEPGKLNDYLDYRTENGKELGKSPLIVYVANGSDTKNIGVGDDILIEDELYCLDIKQ